MLELSGTDFRTFYTILPTDLILSYPARRNANKVKLLDDLVHEKPSKKTFQTLHAPLPGLMERIFAGRVRLFLVWRCTLGNNYHNRQRFQIKHLDAY